jgi:hypothetical protein
MTGIDDYVEKGFPIECRGRDEDGNGVFNPAMKVNVKVYKRPGSSMISTDVSDCQYNCGGHGQYCYASGLNHIPCAYAVDLPLDLPLPKI